MDDRPQGTDPVALHIAGYEWRCPDCDTNNKEDWCLGIVTCSRCRKSFYSLLPEPAFDDDGG